MHLRLVVGARPQLTRSRNATMGMATPVGEATHAPHLSCPLTLPTNPLPSIPVVLSMMLRALRSECSTPAACMCTMALATSRAVSTMAVTRRQPPERQKEGVDGGDTQAAA